MGTYAIYPKIKMGFHLSPTESIQHQNTNQLANKIQWINNLEGPKSTNNDINV